MKLIKPKIELEDQFREMVEEYRIEEEWNYYYKYEDGIIDMLKYIERVYEIEEGIDLNDYPRTSTYWLVDDNETGIYGNVRIRHRAIPVHGNIGYDIPPSSRGIGYGREILRLALEKARELGIEDVRVSCDSYNEGSRRIIISHNGELIKKSIEDGIEYEEYIIYR